MIPAFRGVWRSLLRNGAETTPDARDHLLRGRTYTVPFDAVWRCVLRLVDGHWRGWRLLSSDDVEGVIRAQIHTRWPRRVGLVVVRVTLDEDAQTRVDMRALYLDGRPDLGASVRRIRRLTRALDREIAALREAPARESVRQA